MATKYNEYPLIKRSVHGRSWKLRFPLVIGTTETTCALVSFGVLCFGFPRGSVLWFPSGFCALVFVQGSVLWFRSGFCALVSFGVLCFGFVQGSVLWFRSGFCALVSFGVLCFGFVQGSVLWFRSGFCALVSFRVLCFGFVQGSVLWFHSGFCALDSFGVLICYHLTSFLSRVLFYPTSCSSPLSFDTISALLSCVLHTISALSLYNFCSVIPVLSSVPFLFALLSLIFLSSLSVISVR